MNTIYGSIIENENNNLGSENLLENNKNYKNWLSDTQILTTILIYIGYLHDNESFNFCIRLFTQFILYSIPDTDNLQELRLLMNNINSNLNENLIRLNMILILIIPYTIMNFMFTIIYHFTIFLNSINFKDIDWFNLINNISNNILKNTIYNYNNLFINFIGESNFSFQIHNPINSLYLIFIDIVIMSLQLSTIQILRQRLKHRLPSDLQQHNNIQLL